MNYLSIALCVTVTGFVANSVVFAQEITPTAPVQNQSNELITQPASVNRGSTNSSTRRPIVPYTSERLNGIADSVQVRPQQPGRPILPAGLNPPPAAPRTIDPIDFFRVPALDGGVKVRVD